MFRGQPVNYRVTDSDYLENFAFTKTNKEAVRALEALICKYRVTPSGQIEFEAQRSIECNKIMLQSSMNKLRLKLSEDMECISLCQQHDSSAEENKPESEASSASSAKDRQVNKFNERMKDILTVQINNRK